MTRQAEVSYTPKGTAVAKFGLAINRTWKDESGSKHEDTLFVDVEAWGRTAEIIEQYTDKGHTVFIEGRLKLDQWEDKQTKAKRSKIYVVCEKFHFVSSPRKEGDEQEEPPPKREQQQQRRPPPAKPPIDPDLDTADADDIPF